MKIIFDYNRTLFDPEGGTLYAGVFELLERLCENHELFLVSTFETQREDQFKKLGIEIFFKQIIFVNQKTKEIFEYISSGTGNVFVIGDSIRNEIRIGNILGCTTIRIQKGKFATELAASKEEIADYTVSDIGNIEKIIRTYEN